jgi:FAD dependent oxidoreductase
MILTALVFFGELPQNQWMNEALNPARTGKAPDPVALGSFGMDSQCVQHIVTDTGKVQNEGVIWRTPPRPYGISYRSIVPKTGECENLFSSICLSASHVAHGSIRMEPVFMALSQSAAIAAGMAIDQNLSVQAVPYEALRTQLEAAKQIVRPESWKRPPAKPKIRRSAVNLRSWSSHSQSRRQVLRQRPYLGNSQAIEDTCGLSELGDRLRNSRFEASLGADKDLLQPFRGLGHGFKAAGCCALDFECAGAAAITQGLPAIRSADNDANNTGQRLDATHGDVAFL